MAPLDALPVERMRGAGKSAPRAKWMILLSLIIAPIVLGVRYPSQSDRPSGTRLSAIYDPDPNHLWNRLHRAFYVRTTPSGEEYGHDELDPLLWHESKHLLVGPLHELAIKLLDEFLSRNGAALITDPLKRAMLQRDLWAVFDWPARDTYHYPQERQALESKLAPVIRSLAMSREQIQALPDNYADAVRAKAFAAQYDPERREAAFLPSDLFQPDGPWVCVSARGSIPIAPNHNDAIPGGSVFLVFIRLPEGRSATLDYLKKLKEFPVFQRGRGPNEKLPNPDLPQYCPHSESLLKRSAQY